jgi:hypothetical protein
MAAVDGRLALAAGALLSIAMLGCKARNEPPPPSQPKPEVAAPTTAEPPPQQLVATQPKPGERVRQPLLDGYCDETDISLAFYYHGGRPVSRVAVRDGCSPLYVPSCDDNGTCIAREAEQGIWCCQGPAAEEARAERSR